MKLIISKMRNWFSKEDLKMFGQISACAVAYLSALFVAVIVYIEYLADQ
jgi:hypothetical protein